MEGLFQASSGVAWRGFVSVTAPVVKALAGRVAGKTKAGEGRDDGFVSHAGTSGDYAGGERGA